MSREALESVISSVRDFISAQRVDEDNIMASEDIIKAVLQNNFYYIINIKYPRSLTPELLEDITRIIIDNPDISNSEVLQLAQNVIYVAKELTTNNDFIQEDDSSIANLFKQMMIPVFLEIDGTVMLLANKVNGNNYTSLVGMKSSEIEVSFGSIDDYIRDSDSSDSYKRFNNLIGRIGILSTPKELLDFGIISVTTTSNHVYTTNCFLPVTIKTVTIPTILPTTNIHSTFSAVFGDDRVVDVFMKLRAIAYNTRILDPMFLIGVIPIDEIYQPAYQSKPVLRSINCNVISLASDIDNGFIEPCTHIANIKILTVEEFESKYVTRDLYQAYCGICGERLPSYDDVINVLDKSFGKDISLYGSIKLFDTQPYKNFPNTPIYVMDRNNRVEETFKIYMNDSIRIVSKTLVDILLYHNSKQSELVKRFKYEIDNNNVFFLRLTNQLFISEMYEKEKFYEVKILNLTALYIVSLFLMKANFLLILLPKLKISKNITLDEIFKVFLVRSKLVNKSEIDKCMWLINFYMSPNLLPDNIYNISRNFKSSIDVIKNMIRTEDESNIRIGGAILYDRMEIVPHCKQPLTENFTSYYSNPSSKYIQQRQFVRQSHSPSQVTKQSKQPYLTLTEALSIVEKYKGKFTYEYFYNEKKIVSFNYNSDKELVITSDSFSKAINPFSDTLFKVTSNNVKIYLLGGDPIPSVSTVTEYRIERYISSFQIEMYKRGFSVFDENIFRGIKIDTLEELMATTVIAWHSLGIVSPDSL